MALAVLTVLAGLLLASAPAAAVTLEFETPISGDVVPVTAELSNLPGGEGVAIDLAIPEGEGDLLGLFGNVADESLVPSMSVGDPDGSITQWQLRANDVWKVGGGNAMAPVKDWDWGVKIGATGSPGGVRVETAHFELRASGLTVSELLSAANQGWVLGVRIQSTSGPEGSSKLGLGDGAPWLRIDAPADGTLLGATPAEVLGTVSGSGVDVNVNGVTASVTTPDFWADVPLAEGANTLVATGTNAEGTASDRVEVVLDTTPPVVEITTPADGALTEEGEIAVEGTVSDASPIATVTVNGAAVELVEGAFSTTMPLSLGESPIEAVAIDAAGNEGSDAISVTRGEPPTVSIEAPADGALLAAKPVTVTGTVSGTPTSEVLVNGTPATVSGGSFEASLTLAEGANALSASAANALGEASDEVAVTVDTTPPDVALESPADGSLTTASELVASGTVSDASPIAALTLNGTPTALEGGSFSGSVSLALGEIAIAAVAVDAAGNEGSAQVTVTRGEAPSVTIGSPPEGATVDATPVAVTGAVSGTPPVEVTVAGEPASVEGGSYSTSVPLEEGSNLLTATATNDFGQASATVTVALETGPPLTVAIQSPPDGAHVSSEVITVGGTVSDSEASVVLNGVRATVREGRWSAAAVRLEEEGEDSLAATATRGAETATDASAVVFERPPEVVITAPEDGARRVDAEVDVRGFVDDPTAFVDVNGVDARVASGGRFTAEDVPLELGENRLAARAVDPRGGTGRDAVDVTREGSGAGRLRIVLVMHEGEFRFDTEAPVIAEDGAEYARALGAIGFPPERFAPPIESPARGFGAFHIFVFAEAGTLGEDVSVPETLDFLLTIFSSETKPLLPMDQLENEMGEADLSPDRREELVPSDFDPNGFARFEVYVPFPS